MADVFRNVESDGDVQRIQLGFGYRVWDNLIAKVEFVNQQYSGDTSQKLETSSHLLEYSLLSSWLCSHSTLSVVKAIVCLIMFF